MFSAYAYGQSVPNTETFTLQNVVDAVNPTTDDLQDCFNDANSSYFDPIYNNDSYAPANSMLRFRNYGPGEDPCAYDYESFTYRVYDDCYDYSSTSYANAVNMCWLLQNHDGGSCGNMITQGAIYRLDSFLTGYQTYVYTTPCDINSVTGYRVVVATAYSELYIVYLNSGVIDSIELYVP